MQQKFITVTFNRAKIALRCADILYVIMSDDHCTIHMFDGSVYRCRMTLKALKKQLGESVKEGRPAGSGTAQGRVQEWRQQHPEGRKADCHRDTGLDPKTIRKWWDRKK